MMGTRRKNMHMEDKEDGIDAVLIALLALLWQARQEAPEKPWSLAKLAKRAGVQMSTLLRQLNALSSAGLAVVATAESGGGSAQLSAAGAQLCASVFTAPPAL
jgi:DNA-binding IscR family transcriptional regulator